MGDDAADGEGVGLVAALPVDDGVEGASEGGLLEVVADGVVEGADLIKGVCVFDESIACGRFVEDIGPAAGCAEVVDEVIAERAGAHGECLGELIVAERLARVVELGVGPSVVGEEDGVGVCGHAVLAEWLCSICALDRNALDVHFG